jgi:hypothetical protein
MDPIIIKNYGPTNTLVGLKFNVQPNQYSAIWFELAETCGRELIVQFGGHTLKSALNGRLLTALVPEKLIERVGKIEIKIFYPEHPDHSISLSFNITGKQIKRIKPLNQYNEKRPNFFIVGAPRSGTTSMYWHLSSHPNIYMSKIKEPYFFDKRAYGIMQNAVTSLSSYLSLFQYSPFDCAVIGEASTTYLSSKESLLKIRQFCPAAKILIMLRNPIDAAISLFLRHREGRRNETLDDFTTAWSLCNSAGRTFINNYKELFMIGNQVKNVFTIFNKEQVNIVFFEDLVNDSVSVYENILNFVGQAMDKKVPLQKSNSAKWRHLHTIISPGIHGEMAKHFYPQIDQVSTMIGRNLDHWKIPYEKL